MRQALTTRSLLEQARSLASAASRGIRTQPWQPAGGPLIGPSAADELSSKNGATGSTPSSTPSNSVLRLLERLSAAQNAGNDTNELSERRQVGFLGSGVKAACTTQH